MGCTTLGAWATMDEYDYVTVGEAPSAEQAMTFALGMTATGNVTTSSMRAFTKEEFTALVAKLP